MVCSGADNSHVDAILLVPSCETIDNIDSIPGIQVVDSTFSVDFPDLLPKRISKSTARGY